MVNLTIYAKIRQILLHWGYELKKKDLLQFSFIKIFILFYCIKDELLWKKKKQRIDTKNRCKNMGGEEKQTKKEY